MVDAFASDDPRWQLAERIAKSRSIGRSQLLSKFLLHICIRHLRDETSELTERRIGVEVFGRTEHYDSTDDNIVRNYARILRKRIDEYFATEGWNEELRLEIPRGGYVPVFTPRTPAIPIPAENQNAEETEVILTGELISRLECEQDAGQNARLEPPVAPPSSPKATRTRLLILAGSGAAILVIAVFVFFALHDPLGRHKQNSLSSAQESDVLWNQLFQKDRDIFLVPADSGLVILQGLTQQPVSLSDYASGTYRAEGPSPDGVPVKDINELGTRRYTSVVDLNLISRFSRLKEVVPERLLIRYARDLRMDDLRSGNAILLGSVDSDPWEQLFQQQLNFQFTFSPKSDTAPRIVNEHPMPGEQQVYANRHLGDWHNTFGVIAYLPNLDGAGHILLVGGLNMAGTQAAGDFVLNPALMKPVLDHARSANGSLRSFEILVETDNVAANASRPHVVSERIGPA